MEEGQLWRIEHAMQRHAERLEDRNEKEKTVRINQRKGLETVAILMAR